MWLKTLKNYTCNKSSYRGKIEMIQRKMKIELLKIKRQGEVRENKNTEQTLTKTPYVWHAWSDVILTVTKASGCLTQRQSTEVSKKTHMGSCRQQAWAELCTLKQHLPYLPAWHTTLPRRHQHLALTHPHHHNRKNLCRERNSSTWFPSYLDWGKEAKSEQNAMK